MMALKKQLKHSLTEATELVFFGNYFIGILAVALSVETSFQLKVSLNSAAWYLLLFSGVVLFYTNVYSISTADAHPANPRSRWYTGHTALVKISQRVLLLAAVLSAGSLFVRYYSNLGQLSGNTWLVLLLMVIAAMLYYAPPHGILRHFNLRHTGWAKPLVIGFVWAGCVGFLPLVMLQLETRTSAAPGLPGLWYFIKNWMFCSVNAIMFDIKDYTDDSNVQLKTFVVRYGIHFTIFYILVPLVLTGIAAFAVFARYQHFPSEQVLLNLLPFILTLILAWNLQKQRSILFYLIFIDGMLLVKAVCGIIGAHWSAGLPVLH